MIETFKSKALKVFWLKGDASKLPAASVARITIYLTGLEAAQTPEDMDLPGYHFHKLSDGRFSLRVTANWRLTFGWDAPNAIKIDLEDYH